MSKSIKEQAPETQDRAAAGEVTQATQPEVNEDGTVKVDVPVDPAIPPSALPSDGVATDAAPVNSAPPETSVVGKPDQQPHAGQQPDREPRQVPDPVRGGVETSEDDLFDDEDDSEDAPAENGVSRQAVTSALVAPPAANSRLETDPFRIEYRSLQEFEKNQIVEVKQQAKKFWDMLNSLGASREISLAKTELQKSVFCATNHITR